MMTVSSGTHLDARSTRSLTRYAVTACVPTSTMDEKAERICSSVLPRKGSILVMSTLPL